MAIKIMNIQYIWLIWSLMFITVWLAVYLSLGNGQRRKEMLKVSLWTSLLGLTEPLFVPAYWSPPSLFNLAMRTGFDIESLIFSFGIGGIAAVLYESAFKNRHSHIPLKEHNLSRHRFHVWSIVLAPAALIILLFTTDLNPIYSSIIAMAAGGFAAWYCRPDLKRKMIVSSLLFLGIYFVYFLILTAMSPGYVEEVWNLGALSGILILGIPVEELLFAASFGFIWSSIYEHFTWRRIVMKRASPSLT